jgi:hypothetical protein
MANVYAELGSISWGTLRPEDLIPAFVDALDSLREKLSLSCHRGEELETVQEVSRLDGLLGELEASQREDGYWDGESPTWDIDTLTDELDAFAPPYCYFGTSEGDGSDFGFWPMIDSLEEACENGEVIKLASGDEWPADELAERPDVDGVCYVTDHGNVSFFAPAPEQPDRPLWECV